LLIRKSFININKIEYLLYENPYCKSGPSSPFPYSTGAGYVLVFNLSKNLNHIEINPVPWNRVFYFNEERIKRYVNTGSSENGPIE